MKWYFMQGPGGTIACKGRFPAEARMEAAERWGCEVEAITVTREEEYLGTEGFQKSGQNGREVRL